MKLTRHIRARSDFGIEWRRQVEPEKRHEGDALPQAPAGGVVGTPA